MGDNKKINDIVRKRREELMWSYRAISKLSGISTTSIIRYETNPNCNPRPHILVKLATGLKMDPNILLSAAGYTELPEEDLHKLGFGPHVLTKDLLNGNEYIPIPDASFGPTPSETPALQTGFFDVKRFSNETIKMENLRAVGLSPDMTVVADERYNAATVLIIDISCTEFEDLEKIMYEYFVEMDNHIYLGCVVMKEGKWYMFINKDSPLRKLVGKSIEMVDVTILGRVVHRVRYGERKKP